VVNDISSNEKTRFVVHFTKRVRLQLVFADGCPPAGFVKSAVTGGFAFAVVDFWFAW
jgi:hypothetical protein